MNTIHLKNIIVLIPAAGIGQRMNAEYPKQYITIGNRTLLEHSVAPFLVHPTIEKIVIVVSKEDYWFNTLRLSKHPKILKTIGGNTRSQSVLAGLQFIDHQSMHNEQWVLIHDGVRPCLSYGDVEKLLCIPKKENIDEQAYFSSGAILAIPVYNTIKRSRQHQLVIKHTICRENLWHALTPQLFPRALLTECLNYVLNKGALITDEASALEHCGYYPVLIKGRHNNIKVTQIEDLSLATFYLNQLLKERG